MSQSRRRLIPRKRKTSYSNSHAMYQKLPESPMTLNLRFLVDQANAELDDATENRRATDTKIYTTLTIALVFLGFLISLKPWTSMGIWAILFLTIALALYLGTTILGIKSYFPRKIPAMDTRRLIEHLDESHETIVIGVLMGLLKLADENYQIASEKGYWLQVEIALFLIATFSLAISLVVGLLIP